MINNTFSQSTFQKFYYVPGGEKYHLQFGYFPEYVHQTKEGGYIIAGSRGTSLESSTIFILKTNEFGDTLWTYFYGNEYGLKSISQTTDGGYIITTQRTSWMEIALKFLLIKLDSTGTPQWVNRVGVDYPFTDATIGSFTQQTQDGNFITIGTTTSFGAGYADIYVINTNSNGDSIWTRTYGGTGYDNGISIKQTSDKGYILCGTTTSYGAGLNIILIKTDTAGNVNWSKVYGVPGGFLLSDFIKTYDGNLNLTGSARLGIDKSVASILKTDSLGNVLWCKKYSYEDSLNSEFNSIDQTSDNGYIIVGNGGSGSILSKTDFNGDVKWTKACNGGKINDAEQTKDQGFIIATSIAKILEYDGNSQYPFLIKTDSMGNNECSLTLTYHKNPTVTNEVISVFTISPSQSSGGAIEKYSYYMFGYAGLTDTTIAFNLQTNSSPDTSNTGIGTAWVNISGGTVPFSYQWDDPALQTNDSAFNLFPGLYNVVVTDSNGCTESGSVVVNNITNLPEYIYLSTISIYPNPSSGKIYISPAIACNNDMKCTLLNLIGTKITEFSDMDCSDASAGMTNFKIPDVPSGMYILQLRNSSQVYYSKLVIE